MSAMLWMLVPGLIAPVMVLAADYSTQSPKNDCPPSIRHQADDSVAYKPDVDSRGWALTPVETTPSLLTEEDFQQVEIPIRLPLDSLTRAPESENPQAGTDGNFSVQPAPHSFIQPGRVTVDANHRTIRFNGRDITPLDPRELDPDCISAADE